MQKPYKIRAAALPHFEGDPFEIVAADSPSEMERLYKIRAAYLALFFLIPLK